MRRKKYLLKPLKHHHVPPSPCPYCRTILDTASGYMDSDSGDDGDEDVRTFFGDLEVVPGAITICVQCCHIAVFDANLKLRPFTEDDRSLLLEDPESAMWMRKAQRIIATIQAAKQAKAEQFTKRHKRPVNPSFN